MEYVIGPVVALLISLPFTHYTGKKSKKEIVELSTRLQTTEGVLLEKSAEIETIKQTVEVIDKQTLQKMVGTLQPVASALSELQTFVGLK